MHSGLNQVWYFWLSTKCSCCLNVKSVETIGVYSRTILQSFGRLWASLWNCSRIHMFKTDSFFGNKKLSLNQYVWHDHATKQQDVLFHFWVIFLHWNQAEILFCCPALVELFSLFTSMENSAVDHSIAFFLSTPVLNSEATWKKGTKCNKHFDKTNCTYFLVFSLISVSFSGVNILHFFNCCKNGRGLGCCNIITFAIQRCC